LSKAVCNSYKQFQPWLEENKKLYSLAHLKFGLNTETLETNFCLPVEKAQSDNPNCCGLAICGIVADKHSTTEENSEHQQVKQNSYDHPCYFLPRLLEDCGLWSSFGSDYKIEFEIVLDASIETVKVRLKEIIQYLEYNFKYHFTLVDIYTGCTVLKLLTSQSAYWKIQWHFIKKEYNWQILGFEVLRLNVTGESR